MNGKGRPEKLTSDLKIWITKYQKGHKKRPKAPVIQEEIKQLLENQVRKEVANTGLDWSEEIIQEAVNERLPGISSIQKYIQPVNERLGKPSPLDKPWHLGTLKGKEHYIPAEAIPHVLRVQDWAHDNLRGTRITIWQAQWIARLYAISQLKKPRDLWAASYWYTAQELVCELADVDLVDTFRFDKELLSGKWKSTFTKWAFGNRELWKAAHLWLRGFKYDRRVIEENNNSEVEQ